MKKLNLLFLLATLFLSLNAFAQDEVKLDTLPEFKFKLLYPVIDDQVSYSNWDVPKDKPVVAIYFDPTCDHCQDFANHYKKYNDLKGKITLVWVTWGEDKDVQNFVFDHAIALGPNNYFMKDTNYEIDSSFGYCNVPTFFLFDKNHKFISKHHPEEPSLDDFLGLIKEDVDEK